VSGGDPFKGEPLVYLPVKVSPLGAKLVVTVRSFTPRYKPRSRCESLLENYMVHYVYPTWSAQPHRGVGDAPV
jgi:hypothetical protein